jgi:L-ascorbate metabolism protein UlaG (beta-lactamase superfamily)
MDVQFYGANCLVVSSKQVRLVVDDNLDELGAKSVSKDGDIALFTSPPKSLLANAKLVIDQPGEYEVSGVSIYGIAARAHTDREGEKTATMYKLVLEDNNILVTGHIYPELTDSQLESIGMVDVIFIPVGGNGYTLDGLGALKLVKKIEPKMVIPTHYDDPNLRYPVPQQPLDAALKALGMEPKDRTSKIRLKGSELGEVAQLVVLEKS